ncbi:MAG: beta-ketoacyl-ACP synthase II [Spirochaetes bacterium]|nr:beta-ketoacyl-ACP synthase II [Spirochaetota bacterium]
MGERRVVVTGIGVVCPVGTNVEETWNNLIAGKSGVSEITANFNPKELGFSTYIGGEVKVLNEDGIYKDKKMIRRMDRFVKLGMIATREAVTDSGFDITKEDPTRCGVLLGSGIGGIHTFSREMENMLKTGHRTISPFLIPMLITNILPGIASIEYGCQGPNFSISTACATSNHAIGEAMHIIRRGDADVMFAGGAEGAIAPVGLGGFCSLHALSRRNDDPTRASRPFDKDRDGFVMGEGAGTLILEEYEHAKKRGAKIYAEVVGVGMSGDAHHLTEPRDDGAGAGNSMIQAMKCAGINPSDVGYVNAHGTSTPKGDIGETCAIKYSLKDHAKKVKISSTKSMSGHLLGAAGALEAIVCIKTLQTGIIHPTINIENQDPLCDLDYVPNKAQEVKGLHYALSNSFGFGGHNATLALKKFE